MYDKDIDEADLRRSYFSVGIGYLLAGIFNTSPQTAFSQNVGVVQMSGEKRKTIFINLIILMLLCGLIPKLVLLQLLYTVSRIRWCNDFLIW